MKKGRGKNSFEPRKKNKISYRITSKKKKKYFWQIRNSMKIFFNVEKFNEKFICQFIRYEIVLIIGFLLSCFLLLLLFPFCLIE